MIGQKAGRGLVNSCLMARWWQRSYDVLPSHPFSTDCQVSLSYYQFGAVEGFDYKGGTF